MNEGSGPHGRRRGARQRSDRDRGPMWLRASRRAPDASRLVVARRSAQIAVCSLAVLLVSGCSVQDIIDEIVSLPANMVKNAIDNIVEGVAEWWADLVEGFFEQFFTFWLRVETPASGDALRDPNQVLGVRSFQNLTLPIVGLLTIIGMLFSAIKLVWYRRVDPMMNMVNGLLTVVVVTFAGLFLLSLLVDLSDAMTVYILDLNNEGTVDNLGTRLSAILGIATLASVFTNGPRGSSCPSSSVFSC
ncbi:hypothetical protein J4H86_06725 [Spiractinospora alimapuensis]|uniref:hypothetical protein n=1 Tax=Spiractinospora alimapuensis TaxID=2820884 RepID=UPI001F484BD7|nr:hypothetical protein [Spiractinospora alimapuensis]QVQ53446.1 hypothetical protein J4H86_06725 [Spiractinospora alimapuensis]